MSRYHDGMGMAHLVLASLRRRPLRTALTILSIAVAFILFAHLAALRRAFEFGADVAGVNRLVVRNTLGVRLLPLRYEAQIEEIDGVIEATPITFFGGTRDDRTLLFSQFPLWPDEFRLVYPEFLISDEALERWKRTKTGAVVGRETAKRFGLAQGDHFPLGSRIWRTWDGGAWQFEIVGIYEGASKATDETLMFFRQDYFDENRVNGSGFILFFIVIVRDPDEGPAIAKAIDDRFRNSDAETRTESEAAFLNSFASQVGDVGTILVGILGAVFFTILLVAGNTMMQSVRERTREIGLLKALGFPDRRILGLVLCESLAIALVGGLSGLLVGAILIGRGDPTGGMLPAFYLSPLGIGVGVLCALTLGIVAGLIPAIHAVRLTTGVALRDAQSG
jgi:putative ABC transport system permease protein